MTLAIVMLATLAGIAVTLFARRGQTLLADAIAPLPPRPTSHLDEAERILERRYVNKQITRDEYERMLAVLRM